MTSVTVFESPSTLSSPDNTLQSSFASLWLKGPLEQKSHIVHTSIFLLEFKLGLFSFHFRYSAHLLCYLLPEKNEVFKLSVFDGGSRVVRQLLLEIKTRLSVLKWVGVFFTAEQNAQQRGALLCQKDGHVVRYCIICWDWFHRSKPKVRTKSRVWLFYMAWSSQTAADEMTELNEKKNKKTKQKQKTLYMLVRDHTYVHCCHQESK